MVLETWQKVADIAFKGLRASAIAADGLDPPAQSAQSLVRHDHFV